MRGLEDLALSLHLNKELAEGFGSDSALLLEDGEADGCVGLGQGAEELVFGGGRRRHGSGCLVGKTEREPLVGSLENERQVCFSWCGTVFDGEREMFVASAKVEVGIAPCVELGASAESLTGAKMARGLSGVVDQNDGEVERTLKLS